MHDHRRNLSELSRRLGALTLAGVVFVLGLLAVAPELHERLHADSHEATHTCAVTLFAHGAEPTTPPPIVAAPVPYRVAPARIETTAHRTAAPRGLPPSCGPPRG